jgi:hypothetical protein
VGKHDHGKERNRLEETLPEYLQSCPWFTESRRRIPSASIVEAIPIAGRSSRFFLTLVRVEYAQREPDMYVVPLGWATGARAEEIRRGSGKIIATAAVTGCEGTVEGIVYDATADPACARALLSVMAGRKDATAATGYLAAARTPAFRSVKRWRTAAAGGDVLALENSASTCRGLARIFGPTGSASPPRKRS